MAMVKADAYGHGLQRSAAALQDADGLGVARLQEAIALREGGATKRILLLATLLDAADLATCSKLDIDVVAHDDASVKCIATHASRAPLRVWLKLDSGMHRAGLSPEAFAQADALLRRSPGIVELIHMTHLSDASDPCSAATARQLSLFSDVHGVNLDAPVSVANSAALISRPDTRADWVRPGLMLYGENPLESASPIGLRAAMTLMSFVIAIREIPSGESVGYGGTWTATRPSRIATIGVGYGDGYPRTARNGTPVMINDHPAPLVGVVSMDSLTVDITDCAAIRIGDPAVLWGAALPASTVAKYAATIPYALMTSLQSRVTRTFHS
jgi:alanine racemase